MNAQEHGGGIPNNVVEAVLKICRDQPEGIAQQALAGRLKDVPVGVQAQAINHLLRQHKLEVYQHSSRGLIYKHLVQERAAKFKGLSSEELLVYQLIQSSQNMGIWTRDLKIRSNLQQPQVVKILKVLESRKLIKSIKAVANKNRKVYMVYELEPSAEITGGAWYTENEFDHEFIEVLRNACLKFVLRQQKTTLKAISAFIHEKGLSNVELKEEDISSIVKILVYDGELDEIVRPGADPLYIPAIMKQSSAVGAMEVPCGKCPVYKDCKPGGAINPQNCVYLDEWFGL